MPAFRPMPMPKKIKKNANGLPSPGGTTGFTPKARGGTTGFAPQPAGGTTGFGLKPRKGGVASPPPGAGSPAAGAPAPKQPRIGL